MSPETVGIIGIALTQAVIFAKVLIDGKRKANESHVNAVEKAQDKQYIEIDRLRLLINRMEDKYDNLRDRAEKCERDKIALETRLLLLEEFRDVVAKDRPTGRTKKALPPANGEQK